QVRHATKKSGGSSNNGRTSQPKMLGVKRGQGSAVNPGDIIIRQRGTKWHAGAGVGVGRDHTLFSYKSGRVVFRYDLATQKRIVGV
ncbi:ribosomal protein L27, partial [Chytridium lagenaria]